MKNYAPDFWQRVAETGSLPTTETPVSASTNVADFWKKVREGGALPVTATPLGASTNMPDFWQKVAAQGVVPTTSTLVEFTNEADYRAYVAANGVMPISVGNVYANAQDLWQAIATGTSGGIAYETPAYENAGGTGDRSASITVTYTFSDSGGGDPNNIVDGLNATSQFWANQAIAGKYVQFQFQGAKLITEAKLYISENFDGYVGTSWKWQGSQNGIDWTDIGEAFTPAVGLTKTLDSMSANAIGYVYYRMIGVSGSTTTFETWNEVEFKIGNPL